jgi:twitching motility protein PilJ
MIHRLVTRQLLPLKLRSKVTALAIAIGTLSLLESGATAYPLANQSMTKEINHSIEVSQSDDKVIVKTDNAEQMILSSVFWKTLNGLPDLNREVALAVNTIAVASPTGSVLDLAGRAGLITILVGAIAAFLAKWAISPTLDATNAKKLAQGEFAPNIHGEGKDELAALGSEIKLMADQLQVLIREQAEQSHRQEAEAKRAQLFTDITLRIRESLNLEAILNTAVAEVRQALSTDRVVICQLDSYGQEIVIAESVASAWTSLHSKIIDDPDFSAAPTIQYQESLVRVRDNIYKAGLPEYQIKTLEKCQIKADLVIPIFKDNEIFGLLIAHHCYETRAWQEWEINLFRQLAIQIGFALDQASLLEQQIGFAQEQARLLEQVETARQAAETARQAAESVSQEQFQQKELLQRQVLELLTDVEEATKGNLTVRAEISTGEIGTVADFFNSIIESLRQTVISVKRAAQEVNVSVTENSDSIRQLADEALKQAEEITHTLEEVDQMTLSIRAVAHSANQAAVVARTASTTVEEGTQAMDRTVECIFDLQETVAETAKKVKRLGDSSQEISKVVSLINKIALQTNVLAVNASIEASRAGEEGRGFAVVAAEVGQLATQSVTATKEIQQIVENIQAETKAVVNAMELGTTQVAEGTNLVKATKLSLGKILDVSRQIDQLVQSISSATVSQSQTSQNFANLIQEIAEASERTCNFSRQVSSSLQQTVEVAQQLQSSVRVFKTGAET